MEFIPYKHSRMIYPLLHDWKAAAEEWVASGWVKSSPIPFIMYEFQFHKSPFTHSFPTTTTTTTGWKGNIIHLEAVGFGTRPQLSR